MMDNGGADVARAEVRRAVKRAILLNEYLLRRAWGILYLALSLSMFLSSFGTAIIDSLGSIGVASTLPLDMTASGSGIIAILWAFKRVRNSAEITHPEGDRAWSRLLGYRFLVPLWIAIEAVAILTIAFASGRVSLGSLFDTPWIGRLSVLRPKTLFFKEDSRRGRHRNSLTLVEQHCVHRLVVNYHEPWAVRAPRGSHDSRMALLRNLRAY